MFCYCCYVLVIFFSSSSDLQKFEEQKLSKAKALFSRITNSPPPPGMEDKVRALEERFKNVVKHTEER